MQPGVAEPESAGAALRYDAFISYSHKDVEFAKAFEKALRAYKPPKDLPLPQRRLNVFRDQSDIVGVELAEALQSNLQSSGKLLVLCSPSSRVSTYVNGEIEAFCRFRGAENIVPILVAGIPNGEARADQHEEMAFAPALLALLPEPLAAEFRGFRPAKDRIGRGAYEHGWYKTLADLYAGYDVTRAQIEQRERRRRARLRTVAGSTVAAVMVALAALAGWALFERAEAIRQRDTAVSRQLANESSTRVGEQPDLALLLAAAAYRSAPTLEARQSLQANLLARRRLQRWLWGHSGDVASVAFSPDGHRLAAGGEDDRKIVVWDVQSGAIELDFAAHEAEIRRVVFSPDGASLISADKDGSFKVWDARTGAAVRTFGTAGDTFLETFALAPDGRRVVAAYWSGALEVWDTQTGAQLAATQPHTDNVWAVAFSPDGGLVASASADGTAALWSGSAEEHPRILSGLSGGAKDVAFSADGSRIAVIYGPGQVRVWAVDTGEVVASLAPAESQDASESESLAFSPDGGLLAVGGSLTDAITVWSLAGGQAVARLTGHEYGVHALQFSHDGRWLASVGGDGFRLWRTGDWVRVEASQGATQCLEFSPDDSSVATCRVDGATLWSVAEPEFAAHAQRHAQRVGTLLFSPDGAYLASASEARDLVVWSVRDRRVLGVFPATLAPLAGDAPILDRGLLRAAFSRDGRTLAVGEPMTAASEGGRRSRVALWDLAAGAVTRSLEGHTSLVSTLAFSPDGRQLASADSRRILLFDVGDGQSRVLLDAGGALALAFDAAGKRLAAGAGDDVLIWDLGTDAPPRKLTGHEFPVTHVAFTPDARTLVSASFDGTVRFWSTDGSSAARVGRHEDDVTSLALSADGRTAATGSKDRTVRLWDVERGAALHTLVGHAEAVASVALSPDARLVASAGEDGRVLLWDVATGAELVDLQTGATQVAFSPEGTLLALGGTDDDTVVLRNVELGAWRDRACAVANRNLTCAEWRQFSPDLAYEAVCPGLPAPKDCGGAVDAPESGH